MMTARLNGQPAWIGTRGESYGGMRGATADHVVTGGRALCGLRGPFVLRRFTARDVPFIGCLRCERRLANATYRPLAAPRSAA